METLRVSSAIRFGPEVALLQERLDRRPREQGRCYVPGPVGPPQGRSAQGAAGNRLRHFSSLGGEGHALAARTRTTVPAGTHPTKNVDTTTRNPLFLLRLFGFLLLR